ncbi:methyl-accepting chemotaxis protein [Bacillus badius]|uniref:Methyl-accepting chemotaxis protein n=3 Tax=Bacillus badius TaxID=1455 RepID=A0ABR5AZJ6_BACBA|nr:HAMP domain-containing methyl-accepting chemotaxis protein [Bacillus badius]KIL74978.1 Methyl-accepting chemotaxis protein [Bacillus badius]KIL80040.1 Methyl-accepting chemotaxis protein [Bacillus badius]MED4717928.1 HAMP domain-containing methyl-accepting chemotaxis protein [Bacillus badius]
MKWFYNLKIATKLVSSFILLAAIVAFVGMMGITGINKLSTEMEDMYNSNVKSITHLSEATILYQRMRVNIRDMTFVTTAPEQNAEYEEKLSELKEEFEATLADYEQTKLTDEESVLYKKLPSALEEYYLLLDQAIELARKNDVKNYMKLHSKFKQAGDHVEGTLQELIDMNIELAKQKEIEGNQVVSSSRNLTMFIICLSILLSIGLGYFIARIIGRPLHNMVSVVEAVAKGDLSKRIDIEAKDEVGKLGREVNTMVGNLKALISSVSQNAEQVAAASEELSVSAEQTSQATNQISSTMLQVADGTEKQVRSMQETSRIVSEMSAGVEEVSASSQNVSAAAELSLDKAGEGKGSVQTAVNQMNLINETVNTLGTVIVELGERSKQIGHITDVITGISGQTNLLALNAAIEAARAGEHGSGFAVVADEVRKLAEQSSNSAQEIAALVTWIQSETSKAVSEMEKAKKEVREGITAVETAGGSFEHIYQSVGDVAIQTERVTATIEQVAAGVQTIVRSVDSITEVTEMNAAGTQEVSAATEEQLASMEEISHSAASLSYMAEELQNHVKKFKL